jgi:hypothetical protein
MPSEIHPAEIASKRPALPGSKKRPASAQKPNSCSNHFLPAVNPPLLLKPVARHRCDSNSLAVVNGFRNLPNLTIGFAAPNQQSLQLQFDLNFFQALNLLVSLRPSQIGHERDILQGRFHTLIN